MLKPKVIYYNATGYELVFGVGPGMSGSGWELLLRSAPLLIAIIGMGVPALTLRYGLMYGPLAITAILSILAVYFLPILCQPRPTIKWDDKAITFPLGCWWALGIRFRIPWSEVLSIRFRDQYGGLSRNPTAIGVEVQGVGEIFLRIDGFRKKDLEYFLKSATALSEGRVVFQPPLQLIKLELDNVLTVSDKNEAPSHTSLWVSEMKRRIAPTAFVPLDSGDTLSDGRLKILGQVATGGFSAIYLAETKEGTVSVLKEAVPPPALDRESHSKLAEMFRREAEILSSLEHPRIVQVFDYFIEDNRHYLLMEFIDGETLESLVTARGPQSERTVLRWAKEIAEILQYLHQRVPPVIHKDLTPDNLILDKDGYITLIDFGAANHFLTGLTGTIVGKSGYMPLEQFQGKPSTKSDIYSLGKTLAFLLTGTDHQPFAQIDLNADPSASSQGLNELILQVTNTKQELRPDAGELLEQVKALLVKAR